MNQQQVGVVQMTTAMALSGGVGLWATWAAMPSVGVVFWRCVFGFIALLGFMLFTGRIHRGWISRPQMLWSLAAGTALVLVTHDRAIATQCSRCITIEAGRVQDTATSL